jgi:hypothetical protein
VEVENASPADQRGLVGTHQRHLHEARTRREQCEHGKGAGMDTEGSQSKIGHHLVHRLERAETGKTVRDVTCDVETVRGNLPVKTTSENSHAPENSDFVQDGGHLNEFFDAVDKLNEMDVEINAELLTILVLYSLPSSFEIFR